MSVLFSRRGHRDGQLTGVAAHHRDPLLQVERQVKQVQQSLQVLIDAQSDGLLAGLEGATDDGIIDGSNLSSSRSQSTTVPVRQPWKRKIGLRAAREGILKAMEDLLNLRGDQQGAIDSEIGGRKEALNDVDSLGSKRMGLEESIGAIENGQEGQRSKELRNEASNIEAEITELEARLYELKARQRYVVDEISLHENAFEAKLSSYKASLSLVDTNIASYLQAPPVKHLPSISEDTAFYSLNPKRRTLEMAKTQWKEEEAELEKRRQQVNLEIDALAEGSDAWEQVILRVSGFEKRLKIEMRRSIQSQSEPFHGDDEAAKKLLGDLRETTDFISGKLELARKKSWNLLVCCIGAELEALEEAFDMLRAVFNVPLSDEQNPNTDQRDGGEPADQDDDDEDNPRPPVDLLRDTDAHSDYRREEDDEPDPTWLLPET